MADRRREDIFVSVCFADVEPGADNAGALRSLSARLDARYRYWEILIITSADVAQDCEYLLSEVPNLRLLKARNGTLYYRRRVAVASEAIGDAVLLTSVDELSAFDPIELIETAMARGAIVIGRCNRRSAMNPALKALGRSAGFRVDARDMLTAAYPRTLLNRILAHPDRQLGLRFPPVDSAIPILWHTAAAESSRRGRSFKEFGRRLSLIQKLLVSSAPIVLTILALSSLVVVLCSIAFTFYAVTVWLALETVQEGWFTTSIILSLTAAFLGSMGFGMSIGLQKMIELLTSDVIDDITDERSAVDMFGQVIHELNVDVEEQSAPLPSTSTVLPGAT